MNCLLSIFTDLVNWVRDLDDTLKIFVLLGCLGFACMALIKGIKVNYNPKDFKKMNFLWFLLAVVLVTIGIFVKII